MESIDFDGGKGSTYEGSSDEMNITDSEEYSSDYNTDDDDEEHDFASLIDEVYEIEDENPFEEDYEEESDEGEGEENEDEDEDCEVRICVTGSVDSEQSSIDVDDSFSDFGDVDNGLVDIENENTFNLQSEEEKKKEERQFKAILNGIENKSRRDAFVYSSSEKKRSTHSDIPKYVISKIENEACQIGNKEFTEGESLFEAISHTLYGTSKHAKNVRFEVVSWLRNRANFTSSQGKSLNFMTNLPWIEYLQNLSRCDEVDGDEIVLEAVCQIYNCKLILFDFSVNPLRTLKIPADDPLLKSPRKTPRKRSMSQTRRKRSKTLYFCCWLKEVSEPDGHEEEEEIEQGKESETFEEDRRIRMFTNLRKFRNVALVIHNDFPSIKTSVMMSHRGGKSGVSMRKKEESIQKLSNILKEKGFKVYKHRNLTLLQMKRSVTQATRMIEKNKEIRSFIFFFFGSGGNIKFHKKNRKKNRKNQNKRINYLLASELSSSFKRNKGRFLSSFLPSPNSPKKNQVHYFVPPIHQMFQVDENLLNPVSKSFSTRKKKKQQPISLFVFDSSFPLHLNSHFTEFGKLPPNTIILSSTLPNTFSSSSYEDENAFLHSLVKFFKDDGSSSLHEILNKVVKSSTNESQKPFFKTSIPTKVLMKKKFMGAEEEEENNNNNNTDDGGDEGGKTKEEEGVGIRHINIISFKRFIESSMMKHKKKDDEFYFSQILLYKKFRRFEEDKIFMLLQASKKKRNKKKKKNKSQVLMEYYLSDVRSRLRRLSVRMSRLLRSVYSHCHSLVRSIGNELIRRQKKKKEENINNSLKEDLIGLLESRVQEIQMKLETIIRDYFKLHISQNIRKYFFKEVKLLSSFFSFQDAQFKRIKFFQKCVSNRITKLRNNNNKPSTSTSSFKNFAIENSNNNNLEKHLIQSINEYTEKHDSKTGKISVSERTIVREYMKWEAYEIQQLLKKIHLKIKNKLILPEFSGRRKNYERFMRKHFFPEKIKFEIWMNTSYGYISNRLDHELVFSQTVRRLVSNFERFLMSESFVFQQMQLQEFQEEGEEEENESLKIGMGWKKECVKEYKNVLASLKRSFSKMLESRGLENQFISHSYKFYVHGGSISSKTTTTTKNNKNKRKKKKRKKKSNRMKIMKRFEDICSPKLLIDEALQNLVANPRLFNLPKIKKKYIIHSKRQRKKIRKDVVPRRKNKNKKSSKRLKKKNNVFKNNVKTATTTKKFVDKLVIKMNERRRKRSARRASLVEKQKKKKKKKKVCKKREDEKEKMKKRKVFLRKLMKMKVEDEEEERRDKEDEMMMNNPIKDDQEAERIEKELKLKVIKIMRKKDGM